MLPEGCSTGFDASKLSLLAVVSLAVCLAPQPDNEAIAARVNSAVAVTMKNRRIEVNLLESMPAADRRSPSSRRIRAGARLGRLRATHPACARSHGFDSPGRSVPARAVPRTRGRMPAQARSIKRYPVARVTAWGAFGYRACNRLARH